jgi:phenylalanine-4-hydroxylase
MKMHPLTEEIPVYLQPFVTEQKPDLYTPIDHAVWRYILRISHSFFSQYAHQKYVSGLSETGMSMERIPLIEEMSESLKKFNWRAVAVSGFIPPAVFMEFLSLGILPIACDMRTLDHIAYTPAPDIVHEAAGHAPIIADPEYAAYLRSYGEISRKAIYSSQDMRVYQAIRKLSDAKENPSSTPEEIEASQTELDQAISAQTFVSEATYLSRMGWWTFEYGLVGDLERPKIYGAGLLSSLGESYHCLNPSVKKIPFSIECTQVSYDITRPQPQLFVAKDFQSLKDALEELANQMAFRQGGVEGLNKAVQASTVSTVQFETGIQVSGVLKKFHQEADGRPYYLQFQGPTQIAYEDREIEGQGPEDHKEGFGTPLESISEIQLNQAGLAVGKFGKLTFKSGVQVEGKLVGLMKRSGKPILLTFVDCTVSQGNEVLFRPEWGRFDMICGAQVVSVFGGPADRKRYLEATGGFHQEPRHPKTNLTKENRHLNELYAQVRKIRESGQFNEKALHSLTEIYEILEKNYPSDWLLRYELLELNVGKKLNLSWESQLRDRLKQIAIQSPEIQETISRGLELLKCSQSNG